MDDLTTKPNEEAPMLDEFRERMTDAAQRLTNSGEQAVERVRDAIRANPLSVVGGAVVAGYLIKTLFGSFTLTVATLAGAAYAASQRTASHNAH
ncbi:hypothetical protein BH11MYX1_BH11MYX1_08960 [soil metagenome]